MSYFDDYIADGLCCESCGGLIDSDEPGFVRGFVKSDGSYALT